MQFHEAEAKCDEPTLLPTEHSQMHRNKIFDVKPAIL